MINSIPKTFTYTKATENLFLFYQRASELLFDFSPDSYKVSTHNTHSLCVEARDMYKYLKSDGSISRFYSQYIPDIVCELIFSLKKDHAAKQLLGLRFEKYIEILEQCKNAKGSLKEQKIFESNITILCTFFSGRKYYNEICEQLKSLICGEKHQQDIIILTNIFLCELIFLGYSKQHIYNVIMHFFKNTMIDDPEKALSDLFNVFSFELHKWEIITFENTKLYGYYRDELHKVINSDDIEISDVSNDYLKKINDLSDSYKWIERTLCNLNSANYNVSLIRANVLGLDPYSAFEDLDIFLNTINDMVTVFDNEVKIGYPSIACLNYKYKRTIKIKRSMEKRSRMAYKDGYATRTVSVLQKMRMSSKMFRTFLSVAEFHGDALSEMITEKYTLITLWTALETLFVDNSENTQKSELVIEGLIAIIQRTYITKTLKYLQYDLIRHLKMTNAQIIEKYSLANTEEFVKILFSQDTSEAVKEISSALNNNPLLRSRIFYFTDTCCKTNERIIEFLKMHQQKIEWQVMRIYRARNLIVHTGRDVSFVKDLVEYLHNYLDFILNYIICKSWYGESITDIISLVTEARTDNEIHLKLLGSTKSEKTEQHIFESLFGPSNNILDYYCSSDI